LGGFFLTPNGIVRGVIKGQVIMIPQGFPNLRDRGWQEGLDKGISFGGQKGFLDWFPTRARDISTVDIRAKTQAYRLVNPEKL